MTCAVRCQRTSGRCFAGLVILVAAALAVVTVAPPRSLTLTFNGSSQRLPEEERSHPDSAKSFKQSEAAGSSSGRGRRSEGFVSTAPLPGTVAKCSRWSTLPAATSTEHDCRNGTGTPLRC